MHTFCPLFLCWWTFLCLGCCPLLAVVNSASVNLDAEASAFMSLRYLARCLLLSRQPGYPDSQRCAVLGKSVGWSHEENENCLNHGLHRADSCWILPHPLKIQHLWQPCELKEVPQLQFGLEIAGVRFIFGKTFWLGGGWGGWGPRHRRWWWGLRQGCWTWEVRRELVTCWSCFWFKGRNVSEPLQPGEHGKAPCNGVATFGLQTVVLDPSRGWGQSPRRPLSQFLSSS